MKAKRFIGLKLNTEKINHYEHDYFPDDFDDPYYKIYLSSELNPESEQCQYSINIFINSERQILKIERDKDIYMTNYIQNRMPQNFEDEAEGVLEDVAIENIS